MRLLDIALRARAAALELELIDKRGQPRLVRARVNGALTSTLGLYDDAVVRMVYSGCMPMACHSEESPHAYQLRRDLDRAWRAAGVPMGWETGLPTGMTYAEACQHARKVLVDVYPHLANWRAP